MDPSGPPSDVPAERLFRLLLRAPRASLPVRLPIAGAEGGAFCFDAEVRALHPLDDAAAVDAVAEHSEEVRAYMLGAELTALSLHDAGGRRMFATARAVLDMDERDADAVIAATVRALRTVSPSLLRCNHDAWLAYLTLGAAHPSNYARAAALAGCTDGREEIVDARGKPVGSRVIQRPDRFFGVPIGDMTDGQWLAYRAARAATTKD